MFFFNFYCSDKEKSTLNNGNIDIHHHESNKDINKIKSYDESFQNTLIQIMLALAVAIILFTMLEFPTANQWANNLINIVLAGFAFIIIKIMQTVMIELIF